MRTQHLNSTVTSLSRSSHPETARFHLFVSRCQLLQKITWNSRLLTARHIIYFLSAEIPLIFQLHDFICFESTNILIRGEIEAESIWFLISLVNNNHLQFIASHYCDICSIWDCGILTTVIYPQWIGFDQVMSSLFMMNCFGIINDCSLHSFHVAVVYYLWFQ